MLGKRFVVIGPLKSIKIKETIVDINNVKPIILIIESSELYLPKDNITPQTPKSIK